MSFDPAAFPLQAETHHTSSPRIDIPTQLESFYYFAYGSCMCPVDLGRTIEEDAHSLVIGKGILRDYKLGFNRLSPKRQSCGVLDVVPHRGSHVEGVLYKLPWRVSDRLDIREEVPHQGYRQETIAIECGGKVYGNVRTYVVVDKEPQEIPPDDWYFYIVMRGAMTAKLSPDYSWQLFNHMKRLQRGEIH
ncbi:gamma-glutamylcyclotransferase [[Limnothrix rosea] IAM M-220]|uniref:gamma-glutamylcyclotransferase n=1 Tax=[Limnothrix rosea] IAM M-220 TaxID=454133 RepID=UPI000962F939|nr:gamma-glutamylcyclotransferase [[Limnothrix rosea] IAM M-220]OKH17004.1 gamma-glutamylcyclotransferase [[Limnothrix rosea] IAM M-220]